MINNLQEFGTQYKHSVCQHFLPIPHLTQLSKHFNCDTVGCCSISREVVGRGSQTLGCWPARLDFCRWKWTCSALFLCWLWIFYFFFFAAVKWGSSVLVAQPRALYLHSYDTLLPTGALFLRRKEIITLNLNRELGGSAMFFLWGFRVGFFFLFFFFKTRHPQDGTFTEKGFPTVPDGPGKLNVCQMRSDSCGLSRPQSMLGSSHSFTCLPVFLGLSW